MASKPAPQDHKQKEEKAKVVKATRTLGDREVTGKEITLSGFTVFVNDEAMDDWELLDEMGKLDDQRVGAFPAVLRRLLGTDYPIAMEGLRDKTTGRVKVEAGANYVRAVLKALNPNG